MPIAALAISAGAGAAGLPAVMLACAAVYAGAALWALRFAGGGIARVVADSFREYELIAVEAVPAHAAG